jgi:hypothetical protein
MITVTLANLKDKTSAANVLGGGSGANFVRDRWNQRASVIVSDAPVANSIYTSNCLFDTWKQGGATLGTRSGDGEGVAGSTWVLPQA